MQSTPASFSWKLLACSDLFLWYPQPEQLCPLLCSHLVLGNAALEWFSLLKLSKYDRKKIIYKTQRKQLFLFQLSCHLYRDLSEILRISFVVLLKSSAPPPLVFSTLPMQRCNEKALFAFMLSSLMKRKNITTSLLKPQSCPEHRTTYIPCLFLLFFVLFCLKCVFLGPGH